MTITQPYIVPAATGGSAFAFINSAAKGAPGNSSPATTDPFDSTGADLIVLMVVYDTGAAGPTISDNKGNTYTAIGSPTDFSVRTQLHYLRNPIVGAGHTFSVSGTSLFGAIAAAAFSGSAASPLDQDRGGLFTGTSTANTGGNLTPGFTNELVIAGVGYFTGTIDAVSIDSSFTLGPHAAFVSGVAYGCGIAHRIETTLVAVDPTWTLSESGGGACKLASFKSGISV